MNRDGWDEEDGMMIHLESEAGVDPDGCVFDLDDEIVADGFGSLEQAMNYVERRFAADGHIHNWRN